MSKNTLVRMSRKQFVYFYPYIVHFYPYHISFFFIHNSFVFIHISFNFINISFIFIHNSFIFIHISLIFIHRIVYLQIFYKLYICWFCVDLCNSSVYLIDLRKSIVCLIDLRTSSVYLIDLRIFEESLNLKDGLFHLVYLQGADVLISGLTSLIQGESQ